jgi:hypothetical protein
MTTLELAVALQECEDELGRRFDRHLAADFEGRGTWLEAASHVKAARRTLERACEQAAKSAAGSVR